MAELRGLRPGSLCGEEFCNGVTAERTRAATRDAELAADVRALLDAPPDMGTRDAVLRAIEGAAKLQEEREESLRDDIRKAREAAEKSDAEVAALAGRVCALMSANASAEALNIARNERDEVWAAEVARLRARVAELERGMADATARAERYLRYMPE